MDAPKPPLGSQTAFAQKIGVAVAASMHKRSPKAQVIPAHRWAEKIARFFQRLVFVGLAVVAIKLNWPPLWIVACVVGAVRALAPELTDNTVRWLFSVVKQGKGLKDGPS